MRSLTVFKNHREQIECPMINKYLQSLDEINNLSATVNALEMAIFDKYPLLRHVNEYNQNNPLNSEYVYYINSKHKSTIVRD